MQIVLNLNDNELNTAIMKGINNLNENVIAELAKEALKEYLSKPEVMRGLIFKVPKEYWYGAYNQAGSEPNDWIVDMLSLTFNDDELAEYRKKLYNTLEERRETIIIELLANVLSKHLMSVDMQSDFAELLWKSRIRN